MTKKYLRIFVVISIMLSLISSCQISNLELGEDLLPQGDNILLYRDTIVDIHAYAVSGKHDVTSENFNVNRLMLLGNLQDTIVGTSIASVITQFNSNPSFVSGPNMEIDSLVLFLHIEDYVGDLDQEITYRVYELTERISMDSLYHSDYDPEGRFDPQPLVEKSFMPEDGSTLELLIEDQDFKNKFLALASDTSLVRNDSIFKDFFNGLYIEAASDAPNGTIGTGSPFPSSILAIVKIYQ